MFPDKKILDLHDGRKTHEDELMFWDRCQNRHCKIIKNSVQKYQDDISLNFNTLLKCNFVRV
jgi:hypothetical protein